MQPDWLPPEQQHRYRSQVPRFSGLFFGLFFGLLIGSIAGLAVGLRNGIGNGVATGLISGFILALGVGSIFWLAMGISIGVRRGLRVGLRTSTRLDIDYIEVTEALRWSWSRDVLVMGLLFGIFGVLSFGLVIGVMGGPVIGLIGGLGCGLGGMLLGGLIGGLSNTELGVKLTPNQGVHRSVRNWLLIGLAPGLIFAPLFGLISAMGFDPNSGPIDGLFAGLNFGLFLGLLFGLFFGGRSAIQHYALRWMLYRNGSLPLRLVPFLDSCVERIFLRRVGGGYIFIHRLLLEHFASLYNQDTKAIPADAATQGGAAPAATADEIDDE